MFEVEFDGVGVKDLHASCCEILLNLRCVSDVDSVGAGILRSAPDCHGELGGEKELWAVLVVNQNRPVVRELYGRGVERSPVLEGYPLSQMEYDLRCVRCDGPARREPRHEGCWVGAVPAYEVLVHIEEEHIAVIPCKSWVETSGAWLDGILFYEDVRIGHCVANRCAGSRLCWIPSG